MPDPTAELETRVRRGLADLVAGGPAPSSRHAAVYARAARHEQRFVQRRRLLAGTAAVAVVGGGTAWALRRDGERHVAVGPAGSTDGEWGSIDPAPLSDRVDPAVVWAGDQLIVWGGVVAGGPDYLVPPDGAAWSPTSATWHSIADAPAGAIAGGFGLWDGREMLVGLIEGDANAPWNDQSSELNRSTASPPTTRPRTPGATWRRSPVTPTSASDPLARPSSCRTACSSRSVLRSPARPTTATSCSSGPLMGKHEPSILVPSPPPPIQTRPARSR